MAESVRPLEKNKELVRAAESKIKESVRLLKEGKITLNKLISTCNAFDINVELTLSDKPGAPNPMGTTVVANLTDDGGDNNE